jgi:hypothetical protein
MPKYAGKDGVIYMSTSQATEATVICLSKWSLNQDMEMIETTSFCDSNRTFTAGMKNTAGSLSGFYDAADDKLFVAVDSPSGVKLYLYPTKNVPTKYWYGPAFVTASIEVDVQGAITIEGSFSALGSWGRV